MLAGLAGSIEVVEVHEVRGADRDPSAIYVRHARRCRRTLTRANTAADRSHPERAEHPVEPEQQEAQGHRLRQPEGRRRQDDDDPEPRGRLRREGLPRALRRHGSAGQPDDVPGHRPRHGRDSRCSTCSSTTCRSRRSSASARSTSRAPRSTSPAPRSRCPRKIGRERSLEKAFKPISGRLRLHLHRHAAVPRAAHDQRPDGRRQGDRPRAVRVSLHAWADPAAEHPAHDPGEPEPGRRDRGHPARR